MKKRRPKIRNTETWEFTMEASADLFEKNRRRETEALLGVPPGDLRMIVDDDLPDDMLDVLEDRISLAFGERYAAAREAMLKKEDDMNRWRGRIAKRRSARLHARVANDPEEKKIWRKFVLNHSYFHSDAERAEYEKELA